MKITSHQHKLAVALLAELGMDNVRLERLAPAGYRYYAWRRPKKTNGEGPEVKAGLRTELLVQLTAGLLA
jgi:hypothetical protein